MLYLCFLNSGKSPPFHGSFEIRKSLRGSSPVNMVAEVIVQCCFWSKNHEPATMCQQVYYREAKSRHICFFTYSTCDESLSGIKKRVSPCYFRLFQVTYRTSTLMFKKLDNSVFKEPEQKNSSERFFGRDETQLN